MTRPRSTPAVGRENLSHIWRNPFAGASARTIASSDLRPHEALPPHFITYVSEGGTLGGGGGNRRVCVTKTRSTPKKPGQTPTNTRVDPTHKGLTHLKAMDVKTKRARARFFVFPGGKGVQRNRFWFPPWLSKRPLIANRHKRGRAHCAKACACRVCV